MIVADPEAETCALYEMKHSEEAVPEQTRHLLDGEKCGMIEHRYGKIIGRSVLYRGPAKELDGVQYRNVEDYLRELK